MSYYQGLEEEGLLIDQDRIEYRVIRQEISRLTYGSFSPSIGIGRLEDHFISASVEDTQPYEQNRSLQTGLNIRERGYTEFFPHRRINIQTLEDNQSTHEGETETSEDVTTEIVENEDVITEIAENEEVATEIAENEDVTTEIIKNEDVKQILVMSDAKLQFLDSNINCNTQTEMVQFVKDLNSDFVNLSKNGFEILKHVLEEINSAKIEENIFKLEDSISGNNMKIDKDKIIKKQKLVDSKTDVGDDVPDSEDAKLDSSLIINESKEEIKNMHL